MLKLPSFPVMLRPNSGISLPEKVFRTQWMTHMIAILTGLFSASARLRGGADTPTPHLEQAR